MFASCCVIVILFFPLYPICFSLVFLLHLGCRRDTSKWSLSAEGKWVIVSLVAQIHLSKIDILICVRHVQNHIEWYLMTLVLYGVGQQMLRLHNLLVFSQWQNEAIDFVWIRKCIERQRMQMGYWTFSFSYQCLSQMAPAKCYRIYWDWYKTWGFQVSTVC